MSPDDVPPRTDQTARLERSLIAEFLERRGLLRAAVDALPEAARMAVLKEASVYASARLAEVEARAHYVDDLHQHE